MTKNEKKDKPSATIDRDMLRVYCSSCLIRSMGRPTCDLCRGTAMDPLPWTEIFKFKHQVKYCHSKYTLSVLSDDGDEQ